MSLPRLAAAAVLLTALLAHPAWSQDGFVPFVIPDRTAADSKIATSRPPIAPDGARVAARDGRFVVGDEPLRFWGVNMSFAANFPDLADGPIVADRLAGAGVNSVRFHHMDTARWPRGLWNAEDGQTLAEEALVRMDHFIDALAQRGIYANINLHVGRAHSRTLGLPEAHTDYDKVVNLFTPSLVDAQKQFARDLLTRVNTVRNVRYGDDPAVALVEITNENSLFMWDGDEKLRSLPPYYKAVLQNRYNAWLVDRHGTDEALRAAWALGAEPLGENLLTNTDFQTLQSGTERPAGWTLEQHGDSRATATAGAHEGRPAVALAVEAFDATSWHLQWNQRDIALTGDRYYTVEFQAAASKTRPMSLNVSMAHDPWGNLGLAETVALTPEWQTFRFGFTASATDANSRITFVFGGDDGTVYLTDVQLRPGGLVALEEGESLEDGSVALYPPREAPLRQRDRMRFLAETEKAYFDEMRRFLKEDLGCQSLITGTIVFGPLGLYGQSGMDFIDSHAYWQHPRFPNRPWDQNDWIIAQRAMVSAPESATLFAMAAERLAGKPFTVTEYNHPAPNDYQAECVPLIAAFGAAQDWDGVWLYSYQHSNTSWDADRITSFFDIQGNPGKWGYVRAGAALFRDGALAPLAGAARVSLVDGDDADPVGRLAGFHLRHDRNMMALMSALGGVSRADMLTTPHVFTLDAADAAAEPAPDGPSPGRPTTLRWTVDEGRGFFAAEGRGAWVSVGFADQFDAATSGRLVLEGPAFCAVTVTALDGRPMATSGRLLVTASGRSENVDMGFSENRETLGTAWGQAPARIQPAQGRLTLPPGSWRAHALAPDGTASAPVAVRDDNGARTILLSADHGTMWYLLERSGQVMLTY